MSQINKLTKAQEAELSEVLNSWLAIGHSCEPLNREEAAKIVKQFYTRIGEKEPAILFFSSPIMCIFAYGVLKQILESGQLRDQLSGQLFDQLRGQLFGQLRDQLSGQLFDQLRGQLFGQLRDQLSNYFAGNEWCSWEVFYDFCGKIGVKYTEKQRSLLDLWLKQSQETHWWFPYKGVVLMSERHTKLNLDNRGRLHSLDDIACGYSDGWGIYAIHGVRVAKEIITEPITIAQIEKERNAEVRRVMIERYGLELYMEKSGAKLIHKDECGELYRKELDNDEPIVTIKVVNSTAEPDGEFKIYWLRVPPDIKHAKEAVAWTFGLQEHEYQPYFQS